MSIRLKLRRQGDDAPREFVFDRDEIAIGEGLFNDIVLDGDQGVGVYGVLEVCDETTFECRAHGVEARFVRGDEILDRVAANEKASWLLREGDRLQLGAGAPIELEMLGREPRGEPGIESREVAAFEETEPRPSVARDVCTLTEVLSQRAGIEELSRGTTALLASVVDRVPERVSVALFGGEGNLSNQVHVFTPDPEGPVGESVDMASALDYPGTYERQSAPLIGLGAERPDVWAIVEGGDAFAVYPTDDETCSFFYPIGGRVRGVLDVEWPCEACDSLTERMGRLGARLAPVGRLVLDGVARERHNASLTEENRYFRERQRRHFQLKDLVRESESMQQVYDVLEAWTDSDAPVLLVGEAGSGKSLVARALHHSTSEQSGSFLTLDCRKLSDEVLNVELFGCAECRLPEANGPRKGVFELARGGTVFLDEIDHLSSSLQAKLVRVLNEREVRRLGEAVGRHVRTRLIASTHRDLAELVEEGAFRRDLYLQLQDHVLRVPPLRERDGDVMPLARTFLETFADRYDRPCRRFDASARDQLQSHRWSGNVRELKTVVESAVLNAGDSEVVRPEHLAL